MRDLVTWCCIYRYDIENVYCQQQCCVRYYIVLCSQAVSAVLENAAGFARLVRRRIYVHVTKWQHWGMYIHWGSFL